MTSLDIKDTEQYFKRILMNLTSYMLSQNVDREDMDYVLNEYNISYNGYVTCFS